MTGTKFSPIPKFLGIYWDGGEVGYNFVEGEEGGRAERREMVRLALTQGKWSADARYISTPLAGRMVDLYLLFLPEELALKALNNGRAIKVTPNILKSVKADLVRIAEGIEAPTEEVRQYVEEHGMLKTVEEIVQDLGLS